MKEELWTLRKCNDTTLKKALVKVLETNQQVHYGYKDPPLSNVEREAMELFEEEIQKRLKHRRQMRSVYLVEQCARKVAPIRSPTGIGAGLGEHLAPIRSSLGIGAGLRRGLLIGFGDGGWSPRPKPAPLPFLLEYEVVLRTVRSTHHGADHDRNITKDGTPCAPLSPPVDVHHVDMTCTVQVRSFCVNLEDEHVIGGALKLSTGVVFLDAITR
uniref:Reverse transcriptase domain-containing protein n=1 Tax=Tanacetum cinerariifolium TaxID=118510 RepID=A0A6L2NW88_TANCI|nr:reverse transcriptase domain-containing protein [Tanacetum cinerariifolium]